MVLCLNFEDATVSCAIHMLVFIVTPCLFYVILQSDGKAKAPCFLWQKDAAGLLVENRNHGLARSQSGNNKTVQTLLSVFKSYYQRSENVLQSEDSHL